jgi:hypothetical protein
LNEALGVYNGWFDPLGGHPRLATEFGRAVLSTLAVAGVALQERAKAAQLWETLGKYEADQRIALVEQGPKFRTWAHSEGGADPGR